MNFIEAFGQAQDDDELFSASTQRLYSWKYSKNDIIT
jgi:hypothetical protein